MHEVIVCVDSLAEVEESLPADDRIRVERVGPGAGGNAARQRGVELARGDVVAMLDDDDVWLPEKISTQLRHVTAAKPTGHIWVATSRLTASFPDHDEVWPVKLKSATESISEYIFRKHRVKGGQGFIQASTLLFPRDLALEVPFDTSLRFHQDIDWLRAIDVKVPDLVVIQAPEALTRYRVGGASVSGGAGIDPSESIRWATKNLQDDPRSLGDFILTTSAIYAARRAEPREVLHVAREGFRLGRPGYAAVGFSTYQFALACARRARRSLSRQGRSTSPANITN